VSNKTSPPNRQALARTVGRIRQDLHRARDLAAVIGINDPAPPEVTRALATLQAWTDHLLRSTRP
jgi:hypothetical protein